MSQQELQELPSNNLRAWTCTLKHAVSTRPAPSAAERSMRCAAAERCSTPPSSISAYNTYQSVKAIMNGDEIPSDVW